MKSIFNKISALSKGSNYWYELSSGTTPKEFKSWATKHSNLMKKALTELGAERFEKVSKSHFNYTFFAYGEKTGWIYVSVPDVRDGDMKDILVRSATGPKDYSGGRNQFVSMNNADKFSYTFMSAIKTVKRENNV